MMDMPTPCPKCHDVVELHDMTNIGNELYCEECAWDLEGEEDE